MVCKFFGVRITHLIKILKNCPIMLARFLMFSPAYYFQNYASIIGASLLVSCAANIEAKITMQCLAKVNDKNKIIF